MVIKDDGESHSVPLELASCMIHPKHRLPNDEEVKSREQYYLTNGESPWNPLVFSDQVVDKYYHLNYLDEKQVNIDLKSKNEMDCLHQVHELNMAEERKGISLKCCKILESCEDMGEDDNTHHHC
jgi:hypothetical protein